MGELIPLSSPGVPLYRGTPGDPLVVVVHDWYGRLPWLERLAEGLSENGFWVAVPDLFSGVATVDDDEADKLMSALDVRIALAELDDIVADAKNQGSTRVAVLGFSMGGWLSLLHAQGGSVDAVVAYYATLAPEDHGVVPAPVLLHFAETDEFGVGEGPEVFVERLLEHGTPVTQHTYLGTRHSFANGSIADRFDAREAALAQERTERFLAAHLFD